MFEIAVSDDVLINWKLDEIHELNELTKQTLPEGVKAEDIPTLAANALNDTCCLTNPRQGV